MDNVGLSLDARFGIGGRAELAVGIGGSTADARYKSQRYRMFGSGTVSPSVGAKLLLYEGKRWVPMVAFRTGIGFPMMMNQSGQNKFTYDVQPLIELPFRNRIGERWAIDYSIGYQWGRALPATAFSSGIQYSLYARWLATERFMLGFGVENNGGKVEGLWQVRPNLQLTAQAAAAAGFGRGMGTMEFYGLVGVKWMVR